MLSTYIKHALINIKKERHYVLINFLCLVIGLSIALFLYFWVRTETSYDSFHKDSDKIYRLVTVKKNGDNLTKVGGAAPPLVEKLMSDYPYFSSAVWLSNETQQTCSYEEKRFLTDFLIADTSFFSIFSFPIVEGSVTEFVNNPHSAVISKEFAQKMFGNEHAVGKEFLKEGLYGEHMKKVAMVVDVPRNSHLQFDVLFSMLSVKSSYDYFKPLWYESTHYIKVNPNVDNIEAKLAGLRNVISNYRRSSDMLEFQPLRDIHLKTDFPDYRSHNNSDMAYVWLITIAIFLILLVVFFNHTTLDLSRTVKRVKATSIKRLLGGSRQAIFIENFLGSFFIIFAATLTSLLLTYLAMPYFNNLLGVYVSFNIDLLTILFIAGFCIAIPFLSGIVQLYFTIKGSLAENIKGKIDVLKSFKIGDVLSALQFTAAMFFVFFAFTVSKQIRFMQESQKNKETENIISLPELIYSPYKVDVLRQDLMKNPNIEAVSLFRGKLNDIKGWNKDVWWNGKPQGTSITFASITTDYQLIDLLNLELIEGRFLRENLNVDDYFDGKYSGKHEYVINETAKKIMGFETAVGQTIKPLKDHWYSDGVIVGVVKDFHTRSLKDKIEPTIIHYNPESLPSIIIKMKEKNRETLQYIEQTLKNHKWSETAPFTYNPLLEDNDIIYAQEKTVEKMSTLFALITCILAVMGFLGIVSYYMNQQLNNMVIRKVHGANLFLLIKYYCLKQIRTYLYPAIFVLALSYYVIYRWLENFAYHIQVPVTIFVIAITLFFILLMSIVAIIVLKTEKKSSIDFLRK